jgi:hypothetical protein
MALEPTNITGALTVWEATTTLRLFGKNIKKAVLQQKFKILSTGEMEWRDVEFVHDNSND